MQNRHESILRNVNYRGPLNILTAPTHESQHFNMGKLPHNFYLYWQQGFKTYNNKYRPLPGNTNLIINHGQQFSLPQDLKIDLILSQNKFGQAQFFFPLSEQLNVPIINIEHTLPHPQWNEKYVQMFKQFRGSLNVFIGDYNMIKWGWSKEDPTVRVLHHGIDTDIFSPDESVKKEPYVLASVNDLKNRDIFCGYQCWVEMTAGIPNKIIGDNPGLSKAAETLDELVNEYRKATVFINSSLVSPIPTVVLEAMSCSLPIISLSNCMLPEILTDGYDSFISNDINYLRQQTKMLLKNPEKAKEMGENARKTILEKFPLNNWLDNWNNLFYEVAGKGRY